MIKNKNFEQIAWLETWDNKELKVKELVNYWVHDRRCMLVDEKNKIRSSMDERSNKKLQTKNHGIPQEISKQSASQK